MMQSAPWDDSHSWEGEPAQDPAPSWEGEPTWDDGPAWNDGPAPQAPPGWEADDQAPVAWEQPARQQGRQERRGRSGSRADRRHAKVRRRAQEREARWQRNRLAVPYRIDGPKITFGVIWFAAMLGAILYSPVVLAVLVALVAGLAGLQMGHAWFGDASPAKWWTAFAAFVPSLLGLIGPQGIGVGLGLSLLVLGGYTVAYPDDRLPPSNVFVALARSSLPIGLAAGSLVALTEFELGAIISLLVLVSAYEIGDFLVGSGSSNALEGPISGLVALGAVLFVLWVVAPTPFTDRSMVLFGILAAVCCPLGQILGSALLPRGAAWAPALRRLDSYLVVAPLWLFLLQASPDATSL